MSDHSEADFARVLERLDRLEEQLAAIMRRGRLVGPELDGHRKLLYEKLHKLGFPVLLAKDGTPVLANGGRSDLPKFLLVSVPRSGTHFAAELLTAFGLVPARLHISADGTPDRVQDRRFFMPMRVGYDWKTYEMTLADVIRLLSPGQFVQGHMPFSPELGAVLDGVGVVYVDRDLREVMVSGMRFIEQLTKSGVKFPDDLDVGWCGSEDKASKLVRYMRSFGPGVAELIDRISPWQALPASFTLDFDRLTKPADIDAAVAHLREFAAFVGNKQTDDQLVKILENRVGAPTATWTGKLSDVREYWSEEAEQVFEEIGFRRYAER